MINQDKLTNPFIKVIWEDTPENFTQEKIKRLKSYFKKNQDLCKGKQQLLHLLLSVNFFNVSSRVSPSNTTAFVA